jgi:hypothetical protein
VNDQPQPERIPCRDLTQAKTGEWVLYRWGARPFGTPDGVAWQPAQISKVWRNGIVQIDLETFGPNYSEPHKTFRARGQFSRSLIAAFPDGETVEQRIADHRAAVEAERERERQAEADKRARSERACAQVKPLLAAAVRFEILPGHECLAIRGFETNGRAAVILVISHETKPLPLTAGISCTITAIVLAEETELVITSNNKTFTVQGPDAEGAFLYGIVRVADHWGLRLAEGAAS